MSKNARYWSPFLSQLDPYVPGEQPRVPGLIKLNTNESPYPPSPKVKQAMSAQAIDELRLYPDPDSTLLKESIARYYGLSVDNISVGNGSDEVLGFAFQAFFKGARPLLFPDITYGFYTVYCDLFGIEYREVPLAEDFGLDLADYAQADASVDCGGIIFPNPNAPTGLGLPLSTIEHLLQRQSDVVVIVDEAYVDFGAESAISLIDRYPNLLVVQTLSKSRALAGARVGFAVGCPDLIEGLERVKNCFNPYSVDRLAERAAAAALDDVEYFTACRDRIIATRDWTSAQLQALKFDVLPSQTNFLMARPPQGVDAEGLYRALRDRKVLVRYFNKPRVAGFLRISIGTEEEMGVFVEAVREILTAG